MQQQLRALKNARSDAARLKVAEHARSEGDIDLASKLYLRVALSRLASPLAVTAKQRLVELDAEARQKLDEVQKKLAGCDQTSDVGQMSDDAMEQLLDCLDEFDELATQYGRLPKIGSDIKSALARQKRRSRIQAVLREPEAERLWVAAQDLEQKGQVCCAFQLYEKAALQLPAPSAQTAKRRLDELKADPQNVAASEACRTLQWCHLKYRTAVRVAKVRPQRARELFEQIVQRSPTDSEIHLAARDQILRLN